MSVIYNFNVVVPKSGLWKKKSFSMILRIGMILIIIFDEKKYFSLWKNLTYEK